ncbi:MHS family proline/betaine transporter-like MFS transporter [Saccharopolyspora spinosa]|uniref:Putative proline/betaine transporter n=1 Tax=Saccharopolyspora spinosa TaxID=60894 RepID=A0A2N3Y1Q1_SACSN|nr:MHS family proline/betaine transporter-like MFS transporter [Saccharopolyspora spinosa]
MTLRESDAGGIVPPAGLTAAQARRVALGSAAGTAVEYYDFTVYGLLSVSLSTHFFHSDDPLAALLSTFAIFGVAFVLRPIGGMVFGHLGDTLGRRRVLTATILLMTGSTAVIGVLPTYPEIGLAAPILLLLARVAQGLSAGGETSGAGVYAAESAPAKRRAFYASGISGGALFGALIASVLIVGLSSVLPAAEMNTWGWRIPFLISLPIGLIGFWIRRRLEESPQFTGLAEQGSVANAPLLTAVREHRRTILVATCLTLFPMAGYYLIYIYMPTYLTKVAGFDARVGFWSSTVALLAACVATPMFATLSDRTGRKPMLIVSGIAMCALIIPALMVMNSHTVGLAILSHVVIAVPHAAAQSVLLVTIAEQFPTVVRSSGLSLGYNVAAAVAGGSAPFAATWLVAHTGNTMSPAWFVIIMAVLTLAAAVSLRETTGRQLQEA